MRTSRQNSFQMFVSIGAIEECVHPDAIEVKLIFRQLGISVYQQNTARANLGMHFVLVISLSGHNQDNESILAM